MSAWQGRALAARALWVAAAKERRLQIVVGSTGSTSLDVSRLCDAYSARRAAEDELLRMEDEVGLARDWEEVA